MLPNAEPVPAQPWLDGALARFAADNDELVERTRSVLERVVDEPQRHARMINTLSLLEHMGSHKIMATQHSAAIDQATLKHVAEEAQHAYFMKRQAEKTAARPLEYTADDLLAPSSARMYFQRLEGATVRTLGRERSARPAYLYMSLIVEFRALWVYGLYSQALARARHALSLKRLIGEEHAHLNDMAERLTADGGLRDTRTTAVLAAERSLYSRLLGALERAVA